MIRARSLILNDRNAQIHDLYENVEQFSYTEYLASIHRILQIPLSEQKKSLSKNEIGKADNVGKAGRINKIDKRIFIIGSFLSNMKILETIENVGLQIVGDVLPESGRLASKPRVNTDAEDIYAEIAQNILSQKLSPTQNDYGKLLASITDEIKRKAVQGIIFITQQYCEAYDYFYSVAKEAFSYIPSIQLSVNGTEDNGKASIILEAFADML